MGITHAIRHFTRRSAAFALTATASVQLAYAAASSNPIRLMVGAPPGGSLDTTARIIAPHLGELLGSTVVVENKPGANGTINAEYVAKAPPDGHTLMVGTVSHVLLAPQLSTKSSFNPLTDLTAINLIGTIPQAIAVNPALGVKTLADLISRAKRQPVSMSSSGTGGLPHLTIELLAKASKARFVHVPYKGASPAVNDTIAGHVDGVVMDLTPIYPFVKEGRLVALAVTSDKPSPTLPGVPVASQELAGFTVTNWLGIFSPRNTPEPIVEKVNSALVKVVAREDVREQLQRAAVSPGTMKDPPAFQGFVSAEYRRWGKLLQENHIVAAD